MPKALTPRLTKSEEWKLHIQRHPENRIKYRENAKLYRKHKMSDAAKQRQVAHTKEWRLNLRHEVLSHYSKGDPKCKHCGFGDLRALCLDHINNDGADHRRKLAQGKYKAGNTYQIFTDLKRKNFPALYQVLCCNCNRIKEWKRINHA